METRDESIISTLLNSKGPVTSKYLAAINKVSSRTIRNDIKKINELLINYGAHIETIMGKGFFLNISNRKLFEMFLTTINSNKSILLEQVDTQKDRIKYILSKLLLNNKHIKKR